MANAILKCKECGQYTMEKNCPKCNGEAVSVIPAKFSPEDKYGKYRRAQKQKELE
ncbi:MAG: RNA-protein complex protein Nop10, partial [Candidatus Woesearchaeota archaeon]|nr:RNA-protein complex protein Nop10 [Candidatus Woesearchaeota archaeon]